LQQLPNRVVVSAADAVSAGWPDDMWDLWYIGIQAILNGWAYFEDKNMSIFTYLGRDLDILVCLGQGSSRRATQNISP
jgi:hypothetical protein